MSNSWFQFKQFTVHQSGAAMKVSTDACIQGAWTPIASHVKDVLDIGTGTGLLSLMTAQRKHDVQIDAIELDTEAAAQARENVAASPWPDSIKVINADVCDHKFSKQYDLIVCNPPFFQNNLLGDTEARNYARHAITLTCETLLAVLQRTLRQDGYASVLLPYQEHKLWEKLVFETGLHVFHRLLISPSGKGFNRVVSLCGSKNLFPLQPDEVLRIYAEPQKYTQQFAELLASFYLYL